MKKIKGLFRILKLRVNKKVAIIVAAVATITVVGSLVGVKLYNNHQEETVGVTNVSFAKAMASALVARWSITDKDDNDKNKEYTKNDYLKYVDAELKVLSPYTSKKFKSSKTQEILLTYINDLKAQKRSLDYWGTDKYNTEWNKTYSKRAVDLKNIVETYKIEKYVPEGKSSNFDDILGTAKKVEEDGRVKEAVSNITASVSFTRLPDAYSGESYHKYETVVENTTNVNFKTFTFIIKLIDKEGIVVDTQHAYAYQWAKGDNTKFEFSTDAIFEKTEIIAEYTVESD